jgi:hypothetical protein
MRRQRVLRHEFVELIPDELTEGTIYVCIGLATVVHKCCCGCGNEVVTPLSPTDWKLTHDGETITLHPSIGNWSFGCRSHYWIRNNRVTWAGRWSQETIEAAKANDRRAKDRYFGAADDADRLLEPFETTGIVEAGHPEKGIWHKLKKWWAG